MISKTNDRRQTLESYIDSSTAVRRRSIAIGVAGLLTGAAVGQFHGFAGGVIALAAGAVLVVGPYITTMHITEWRNELTSSTESEKGSR